MESSAAERRLSAIQGHLVPATGDLYLQIQKNNSAGEFFQGERYSVVLPEKLQTGKWNVYRSACSPLKLVNRFPDHPEIGTLHDNIVHAVEAVQEYKYLGTWIRVDGAVGEYKWMTYGEAATARLAIGSGLCRYGLKSGSSVGLFFINRPEWLIVDHACSSYSYISVPLYDTLGPEAVKYIVGHADIQAIFCVPSTLNTVVGGADEHLPSLPSTSRIKVISYSKLLDQLHVIFNRYISYHPLVHIYERANQIMSVYYGVAVGFYQGDNVKLMDDLAALRPTIFCSVPRLYNRIYAGITNAVKTSGALKERLFNAAYNSKKQAIMSGRKPSPVWDRLLFNKIKEKLGGRVCFMGSGASPLSPHVMDFSKAMFWPLSHGRIWHD